MSAFQELTAIGPATASAGKFVKDGRIYSG